MSSLDVDVWNGLVPKLAELVQWLKECTNLQEAASVEYAPDCRKLQRLKVVVDEGANAATNTLTLSAYAGNTINSSSTLVVSTDHQSTLLHRDGGTVWIVA
jgi:hypothetical protein